MTATFLVTLDLPEVSESTLTTVSTDIEGALMDEGLPVVEVKPWKHPSLGEVAPELEGLAGFRPPQPLE